MNARSASLATVVLLLCSSCDGILRGPNGDLDKDDLGPGNGLGPGGRDVQYLCDEDAGEPDEAPLRRLTRLQIENTIGFLVDEFAGGDAAAIRSALAPTLDRLPEDSVVGVFHGGLRRLDQALQQQLTDGVYDLSVAVGEEFTASSGRISRVIGDCATDGDDANDLQCLEDFVRRFGARAFRQPLSDPDVSFYANAGDGGRVEPETLATVIALMLASPQFFYHMEHGVAGGGDSGTFALTPYELAARISYQFWNLPPDDELWAAAADGSLSENDVYRSQVERLLVDERAQQALGDFFHQWTQLDSVPRLDGRIGEPLFDAFAGADVPDEELRDAIIADVVAAAQYEMKHGGNLSSFLGNSLSFARHEGLARIYGTEVWDGESEPPEMPAERAGLLTRAAFLVTGTANTRPVKKGVYIRTGLLCDTIPPPPADAALIPPEATGELTTREALEQTTEAEGTVCAGCHKPLINGLGYVSESFDALGRHRTVQTLYDQDAKPIVDKPVDTTAVPQVIPGDMTVAENAHDLLDLIDASGKAHSCLARDYFRFTFQRMEDEERDGCVLADLEEQFQLDSPLVDVFAHLVMSSTFRQKRFAQ